MRESAIQKAVIDHWRALGLPGTLVAAIPNQWAHGQAGLTAGLADLLCIGPGGAGFIELKAEKGRMSAAQIDFKAICLKNEVRHEVTFGREEPIRVLERWGLVRLSNR